MLGCDLDSLGAQCFVLASLSPLLCLRFVPVSCVWQQPALLSCRVDRLCDPATCENLLSCGWLSGLCSQRVLVITVRYDRLPHRCSELPNGILGAQTLRRGTGGGIWGIILAGVQQGCCGMGVFCALPLAEPSMARMRSPAFISPISLSWLQPWGSPAFYCSGYTGCSFPDPRTYPALHLSHHRAPLTSTPGGPLPTLPAPHHCGAVSPRVCTWQAHS